MLSLASLISPRVCALVPLEVIPTLHFQRYSSSDAEHPKHPSTRITPLKPIASIPAPLRREVRQLYKTFLYLSNDYPDPPGPQWLRNVAKRMIMKNRDLRDEGEIRKALDRGNYVVKEIEALYQLKKYRHLKKAYYDEAEIITRAQQRVEHVVDASVSQNQQ
ncbi:hypothetical protein M427DRAFT_132068 [Gonapodya prolifera JEL478]|uniref:Complex 1 LYR protein domain-containing protein n=1 Tax=Gonapodya prolifera (strain JEL478) TaxID=1344416 RepID=A0A139AS52_GONPJ|nr:hypothetical protein M427DRAFT_132068 [Gonapodya prolifera JEL478]|eukprot:KXS19581.1 hypothetical protein M427DRAFT_132068 [Gonapodya prolifera JEL478]